MPSDSKWYYHIAIGKPRDFSHIMQSTSCSFESSGKTELLSPLGRMRLGMDFQLSHVLLLQHPHTLLALDFHIV